ncbi:fungal-specific transcription factor domain-containing protein [Aspergillus floccosus]
MLNVRIDKLPPDRATASKDCHSCYRRRIKCDRSLPKCRKCTIRGLQCPGFDLIRLKWDQGVASRGSFAGRRTPVRRKAVTDGRQSQSSTLTVDNPHSSTQERDETNAHPAPAITASPTADSHLVDGHSSLIISNKLFAHFNDSVAPRLTWIDSPDHPWRRIVLPLAQHCPSLRMAILRAAAAHLSSTSTQDAPYAASIKAISHNLRDTCIRNLNRAIKHELGLFRPEKRGPTTSPLVEILATTLVLCYGEMVVPDSADWHLHLHACRLLIERQQWRNDETRCSDPVAPFLLQEVADIEVYYSLGTFSNDQSRVPSLPQSVFCNHFRTFTGLLYEITAEERKRHRMLMNGQPLPDVDMGVWRQKLEQACIQASTDTLWLARQGEHIRQHVNALIQTYYHAALIYSYQALAPHPEASTIIRNLVPQLLKEIEEFTNGPIDMFSHNIFLPLFIAGTECWDDDNRQHMIEELFLRLVSTTGLWCNYSAMRFLKAFWTRPEYHGVGRWNQYARDNESGNSQFFVF